jgi:hypothetical protein
MPPDSFSDPRAATAIIVDGPPDLVGEVEIYRPVTIDGRVVALPAEISGIPEYITVARAESEANTLRPRLTENLDSRNPDVAFQLDATLAFEFYAACGTTVTEAVAGLEGFANHFVGRHFDKTQILQLAGVEYRRSDIYDRPLNERFKAFLPPIINAERPGTVKAPPTSEPWWPVLRRVQGLAALERHAVSEPVGRRGLKDEKPLLQRFVDGEYRGAARMLLEVFDFFMPGWISPERQKHLPDPPTD